MTQYNYGQCQWCYGQGWIGYTDDHDRCLHCGGSGREETIECPECTGSGCKSCDYLGYIDKPELIDEAVPVNTLRNPYAYSKDNMRESSTAMVVEEDTKILAIAKEVQDKWLRKDNETHSFPWSQHNITTKEIPAKVWIENLAEKCDTASKELAKKLRGAGYEVKYRCGGFLVDYPIEGTKYHKDYNNLIWYHCWVQVNNKVLDITLKQFQYFVEKRLPRIYYDDISKAESWRYKSSTIYNNQEHNRRIEDMISSKLEKDNMQTESYDFRQRELPNQAESKAECQEVKDALANAGLPRTSKYNGGEITGETESIGSTGFSFRREDGKRYWNIVISGKNAGVKYKDKRSIDPSSDEVPTLHVPVNADILISDIKQVFRKLGYNPTSIRLSGWSEMWDDDLNYEVITEDEDRKPHSMSEKDISMRESKNSKHYTDLKLSPTKWDLSKTKVDHLSTDETKIVSCPKCGALGKDIVRIQLVRWLDNDSTIRYAGGDPESTKFNCTLCNYTNDVDAFDWAFNMQDNKNINGTISDNIKVDNMKESNSSKKYTADDFSSGDKVMFTSDYAGSDAAGEVFTLTNYDPSTGKGRVSDEQGMGWGVSYWQIVPAEEVGDPEESVTGSDVDRVIEEIEMQEIYEDAIRETGGEHLPLSTIARRMFRFIKEEGFEFSDDAIRVAIDDWLYDKKDTNLSESSAYSHKTFKEEVQFVFNEIDMQEVYEDIVSGTIKFGVEPTTSRIKSMMIGWILDERIGSTRKAIETAVEQWLDSKNADEVDMSAPGRDIDEYDYYNDPTSTIANEDDEKILSDLKSIDEEVEMHDIYKDAILGMHEPSPTRIIESMYKFIKKEFKEFDWNGESISLAIEQWLWNNVANKNAKKSITESKAVSKNYTTLDLYYLYDKKNPAELLLIVGSMPKHVAAADFMQALKDAKDTGNIDELYFFAEQVFMDNKRDAEVALAPAIDPEDPESVEREAILAIEVLHLPVSLEEKKLWEKAYYGNNGKAVAMREARVYETVTGTSPYKRAYHCLDCGNYIDPVNYDKEFNPRKKECPNCGNTDSKKFRMENVRDFVVSEAKSPPPAEPEKYSACCGAPPDDSFGEIETELPVCSQCGNNAEFITEKEYEKRNDPDYKEYDPRKDFDFHNCPECGASPKAFTITVQDDGLSMRTGGPIHMPYIKCNKCGHADWYFPFYHPELNEDEPLKESLVTLSTAAIAKMLSRLSNSDMLLDILDIAEEEHDEDLKRILKRVGEGDQVALDLAMDYLTKKYPNMIIENVIPNVPEAVDDLVCPRCASENIDEKEVSEEMIPGFSEPELAECLDCRYVGDISEFVEHDPNWREKGKHIFSSEDIMEPPMCNNCGHSTSDGRCYNCEPGPPHPHDRYLDEVSSPIKKTKGQNYDTMYTDEFLKFIETLPDEYVFKKNIMKNPDEVGEDGTGISDDVHFALAGEKAGDIKAAIADESFWDPMGQPDGPVELVPCRVCGGKMQIDKGVKSYCHHCGAIYGHSGILLTKLEDNFGDTKFDVFDPESVEGGDRFKRPFNEANTQVNKWGVWCVSDGVMGHRERWAKEDDHYRTYETEEEANTAAKKMLDNLGSGGGYLSNGTYINYSARLFENKVNESKEKESQPS
jgi:hypothetical protein